MTPDGGSPAVPVRIELATSELEGGRFRAWADPARVLTVLAISTPEDTFSRFVEPRLRELELAPTSEVGPEGAPLAVQSLLATLRETHARLWRENCSLMRESRTVQLCCALADEERVYFIKGAPAWACLLRGGRAHPAVRPTAVDASAAPALGRTERLQVEVTSLAVRPGDTVIVFSSESDIPPDLRALENLFEHTPDLKRACDGLVSLLGLQAQGANAVAFRFVPVMTGPRGALANPLDDLVSSWEPESIADGGSPAGGAASGPAGPTAPSSPAPLPPQPEPEPELEDIAGLDTLFPTAPPIAPRPASAPPSRETEAIRSEVPSRPPDPPPAEPAPPQAPEPVAIGAALVPDETDEPRSRWTRPGWLAVVSVVVVMAIALVALPRSTGGHKSALGWLTDSWRGGGGTTSTGTLIVEPEPAAQAVLIDGKAMAAETPVQIDSIATGRRRVALDLGPSGFWEQEYTVRAGKPVHVAPHLRGSIAVRVADAGMAGRAWMQGRRQTAVPAVFDSLPVGWNRIFYGDDRLPLWDRLVLVKPGKTTEVEVPNEDRGGQGAVRVEGLRPRGREGLVESTGDTVRVDGRTAGMTPLDFPLSPGLHSVRVGSAGPGSYTEVLEIKAGGVRTVVAELGGEELPFLSHVAPGHVLVRGPILMNVLMAGETSGWTSPALHLPDFPPGARDIPMTRVEGDEENFVGVVSPESVPLDRELRYYFTANGPEGRTVWSDVYRLYPETRWSGMGSAPRSRPVRPEGTVASPDAGGTPPPADPASDPEGTVDGE